MPKAERVFTGQTSNKMPCGTYVAALTTRAVRAEHRIQAKGSEPSTSARNGVPMYDSACQTPTLCIPRNRTCPRVCLAGGPLDKNTGRGDE
jgi:hypothetical protein